MAAIGAFLKLHWMPIVLGLLVLGAIWKIDQNGYNRAKDLAEKAELERQASERRINAKIEAKAAEIVAGIDAQVSDRLGEIDVQERTIVMPTIQREIRSDPRFSNPDAGITVGMFDAINSALSASNTETPSSNR